MTQPTKTKQELNEEQELKLRKLLFAYQRSNLPNCGSQGIHNRNITSDILDFFDNAILEAKNEGKREEKERMFGELNKYLGSKNGEVDMLTVCAALVSPITIREWIFQSKLSIKENKN